MFAWARVVLGWVTSWKVLVLLPTLCFLVRAASVGPRSPSKGWLSTISSSKSIVFTAKYLIFVRARSEKEFFIIIIIVIYFFARSEIEFFIIIIIVIYFFLLTEYFTLKSC